MLMKRLSDFKQEIEKCSKCGLCQSVCPVYKVTRNDCAVSRGKFVMLNGVIKGDLTLNKNINKYLDLCLKCEKCTDFCPSEIDVCKIFETAKYEYSKETLINNFIFALQSSCISFVNFLECCKSFFFKNCHKNALNLLYFKGCAGKISYKTSKLLSNVPNIKIIEKNFDCCGLPFLSSGNLERFEKARLHNAKLIKNSDFDYILTDCASCENTLKKYIDNEKFKFINLGELLLKQKVKFKSSKPVKVTFHKPCHLKNYDFLEPLLKNIENVEYIEMEGLDDCCGFAGEFGLKNRKISKLIIEKKAQNIIKTRADYVITTCPACILGLKLGLLGVKNAPKVYSLTDFLFMNII